MIAGLLCSYIPLSVTWHDTDRKEILREYTSPGPQKKKKISVFPFLLLMFNVHTMYQGTFSYSWLLQEMTEVPYQLQHW